VKDNGRGVPVDDQTRVFEMFYRVRDSASIAGSGIGLAICRRIVETHGGEIWAKSELGRGSEFWFSLDPATSVEN
jgi:signal transduction histidine kinase